MSDKREMTRINKISGRSGTSCMHEDPLLPFTLETPSLGLVKPLGPAESPFGLRI